MAPVVPKYRTMSGKAGVYSTMETGPTAISSAPIRVTFSSLINGAGTVLESGSASCVVGVGDEDIDGRLRGAARG